MALGLSEQMTHSAAQELAFEERLTLLLEREQLHRENRRLTRLLQLAQLKERGVIEDIDYRSRRGLDRSQLASLASCEWIRAGQGLLIQGATGCGKNLSCLRSRPSSVPPGLELLEQPRCTHVPGAQALAGTLDGRERRQELPAAGGQQALAGTDPLQASPAASESVPAKPRIQGATGCGSDACALAHQACRQGLSAWYVRAPRLFEELALCHADGSFRKRLTAIAKIQLIVIDDFAIAPIGAREKKRSARAPR